MLLVTIFFGLIVIALVTNTSEKSRSRAYFVALLGLFFFSAFRFRVGCDWAGYLHQFNRYGLIPLSEVWTQPEPLWVALFSIQHSLDLPYPWINVVSSLIFFLGAHRAARRQPDKLAFLILLFPFLIINMPMSGIRQGAAIGVMFLAFNAFVDRATFRFVGMVLLATALHQSALIFLLLAPLISGEYSSRRVVLAMILAIPGVFVLSTSAGAEIAVQRYIETDSDAYGAVFRVGLVALTGVYFLSVLRQRWQASGKKDFKLAIIGSLMMIAVLAVLPISTVIADRFTYYLMPIQVMILARAPYLVPQETRSIHVTIPYTVFLLALVGWTTFSYHAKQCYDPYQTWIFGYPKTTALQSSIL